VVGAIVGQAAWRLFAHDQGVATDAVVSTASFVVIAGGSIAVALLAAAFPAWVAARSHPTRALRAE
jgi:ABC-type antimicrobial peptide transport system permease subunit